MSNDNQSVSSGELTDGDLDAVSGGASAPRQLGSSDPEEAKLQSMMAARSATMQMASSIVSKLEETSSSTAKNIK